MRSLRGIHAALLTAQSVAEVQVQRDKAREAKLRAVWDQLPAAERESILAAVKVQNPGLGLGRKSFVPVDSRIHRISGF